MPCLHMINKRDWMNEDSLRGFMSSRLIDGSNSTEAKTCGSIAYVSQNAWIQNATIEDNILFGETKVTALYGQVLDACALVKDLQCMDHGDQTEIGEKGINLSGGQKQRIQLARAVYQNADVYLLDDIFSAVDAHTGTHIFKECILGALHGKTILLVTHQVEFLARADVVLVMSDGRISQAGQYEMLLADNLDFRDLIAAYRAAMELVNKNDSHQEARCARNTSTSLMMNEVRFASLDGSSKTFSSNSSIELRPDIGARLIEAEQRETGKVGLKLYKEYLTKAYGLKGVILLLLGQLIWQVLLVWSDFWISQEIPANVNESYDSMKFIIVYAILNAASWVAVVIRIMLVAAIGLKAAQLFFLQMLHKIFRAPMSFFDTTPSGRVLSRFSSDQANLDFAVHYYVGGMIACWINVLSIIAVICISAWPIIIFLVPLTFMFKWYQDFFLASSREMTRLDSITKGPLIYHTSETVAGIETIRCFLKQNQFELQNFQLINSNMKMDFCNTSANEWLGFRLDGINAAILTITAILFVVLPQSVISPEIVGLALSYALSLNAALFLTVSMACTAENKMVSVERVRQFTSIASEADQSVKSGILTPSWPSAGKLVSIRLKLRYRPGTPLILKGVSFTIEGGHKVGVVGRTGSGKSTFLLAIFRLVEPVGGQVLIDDVDITQLGLEDLRSRLGIVPQEPVLFEGTIRMNLDPFNSYSDDEIWMKTRFYVLRIVSST
ncbi:hypothetical protein L7F22_031993 [Adiantum nelumboides]|nr:hypothetical protein [Adiantum nelumboides]